MNYNKTWNKVLGAGEKVELEFSLSHRYLNINIAFWLILGMAIFLFGGLHPLLFLVGILFFTFGLFYFGFYLRWANHFAVTNRRLLIHRGWLSTRMTSVDYSQVTDVEVYQSFTERMLYNSGRLMVNTAGSAAHEIILNTIGDPYAVKQKLTELMEKDEQQSHYIQPRPLH